MHESDVHQFCQRTTAVVAAGGALHKTVADNQLEHVVLSFGLVQYVVPPGMGEALHVEPSATKVLDTPVPVQSGV